MTDWWWVVVLVALAAVGVFYLVSRRNSASRGMADRQGGGGARSDYGQDREDARVGHMSEEDRAWEAASLRTDRDTRERDDTPADRRA